MVYHIILITTIVPLGATLYINNIIFNRKLHLLLVYTFHLTPPPFRGIDDGYDPMNILIQHFLKQNMFITTETRGSVRLQNVIKRFHDLNRTLERSQAPDFS